MSEAQSATPHPSFGERLKAIGRELANDQDLQAGLAQVVMAIAGLAVRALTSSPEPSRSTLPTA